MIHWKDHIFNSHQNKDNNNNQAIKKLTADSFITSQDKLPPLPSILQWKRLPHLSEEHIKEYTSFLQENYIGNGFIYLDYSYSFLHTLLKNSYLLLLVNSLNQRIVGGVVGIPINIRIQEKKEKWMLLDFLCIKKENRKRGLTRYLIQELYQWGIELHFQQAVFTRGNAPTQGTFSSNYWIRSINDNRLRQLRYLAPEEKFPIIHTSPYQLHEATLSDVDKVEELFQKMGNKSTYQIVPFISRDEIIQWLNSSDFHIYFNSEKDILVSWYDLPYGMSGREEKIKTSYLFYYYLPPGKKIEDLLKTYFYYLYQLKYDLSKILDMGELSPSVLTKLKCQNTKSQLHYYFYNWQIPQITKKELNLIFF